MADIATKYYVRRGDQEFATIASLFGGVRILKIEGMTGVGSAKNIYTASWVDSQSEDYMVVGDSVVRENVDINITFIVSNKYGAVDVRQQHDAFVAYMTDGELYLKSDYIGRTLLCVCLKDYKPTTEHLKRTGNNDYIIGTITLHALDNRAGDDDGYIGNPYPTSGDTPTPPTPPQQVSTTNVYDAALGATQATLNQRFNEMAVGSNFYTKSQVDELLAAKQDNIVDIDSIRSGATKGSTSLQEITQQQFNAIFD
jgi:hypothetical protein